MIGSAISWTICKSSALHSRQIIMPAPHYGRLWNTAGHYIFVLWFLVLSSIFFSSPILSCCRLDVYHTTTHGVALVQI